MSLIARVYVCIHVLGYAKADTGLTSGLRAGLEEAFRTSFLRRWP